MKVLGELSREIVRTISDLVEAGPVDLEHVVCKEEDFIEANGAISQTLFN